ncbi:MAG: FG-GAP repeat protein [Chloracidobacterium sp.]|nr:FG-GAP repeat protein [Chloracidobacterium sp.]
MTWTQQQKLTASDGTATDIFGSTVAVSGETIYRSLPDNASRVGICICWKRPEVGASFGRPQNILWAPSPSRLAMRNLAVR